MRVSSLSFFTSSLAGIQQQQASIARLNQQIALGVRILAPKDDPVGTNRVLDLSNRIDVHTQYLANQQKAELALNYESTVVTGIRDLLVNTRTSLGEISPSHELSLREQYADVVAAAYQQLKDLGNTSDPSGNYIFSGYATSTTPFSHSQVYPALPPAASGASAYLGTPNGAEPNYQRFIEIDTGRLVQVNHNLNSAYQAGGGLGTDLLQTLDQLAINLADPTGAVVTQADIDNAVAAIDAALDGLGAIERSVFAAQQQIGDAKTSLEALIGTDQDALTALLELDDVAAITELQLRQTTLEAAQSAYARTVGLSLFNFL